MADENQTESVPSASVSLPCATGCGFYGSPATLNLCSKCFNDHQKRTAGAHETAKPDDHGSTPQPDTAALSGKPSTSSAGSVPPVVAAAAAAVAASASKIDAPDSHKVEDLAASAAEAETRSLDSLIPAPSQEEKEERKAESQERPESEPAVEAGAAVGASAAAGKDPEKDELPARKVQKNTSRCFSCKKKVGLTGFKCRCDYVFCAIHRYADAHQCDFDYKTAGREQISKENPLVVAAKLEKI